MVQQSSKWIDAFMGPGWQNIQGSALQEWRTY
jgi:hypothetical protein